MGKPAGCRVCGRRLSFHQLVSSQLCDTWRCNSKLHERDMADYRDLAARAVGIRRPDAYPMVVVPDYPALTDRQPQARIHTHINFLFDLCLKTKAAIKEGGDTAAGAPSTGFDPPGVIKSRVCSICKGSCCQFGKERAFLDNKSMRRFMRLSGLSDPSDIVQTYSDHLPEKAVIDACVYHADGGCTLPRWMRGDKCNAYHCKGLSQIDYLIRYNGASRAFVVVRKDRCIERAAFVTRDAIRHYPASGKEAHSPTPANRSCTGIQDCRGRGDR